MTSDDTDAPTTDYDVFVVGGGINGCGIARDVVGRGLSVGLAEMNDLASATSSASTKLFHGGLRYLEYFELRLVREALIEREILLQAMPHISWPMRFVLPYHKDMRFEGGTPTAKLLSTVMPWMKGRRPGWLIRLGLLMYDNLGGRKILPATSTVDLRRDPVGDVLDDRFRKAYEYSDCWVQDARLVVLNARDAKARGADIMVRTRVVSADRKDGVWDILLNEGVAERRVTARMIVNAAGPWVGDVIRNKTRLNSREDVRLVRGSHIITKRLFDHDKCYLFQGTDGRIIFAIPYEEDFTLIGTTDQDHDDPDNDPVCTPEEQAYLIDFASGYFKKDLTADDVVSTFSGVRPLYDDGAASASAATRDYVLTVDDAGGAPILSVFGGKITSYRKLAQSAFEKIAPYFGSTAEDWTAGQPLPGGDFPVDGVVDLEKALQNSYPFLTDYWTRRLVRTYGTVTREVLGNAKDTSDLGEDFGATITAQELDWAIEHEWVRTAEDFVWRRTKLGLRLTPNQIAKVDAYIQTVVA